MAWSQLAALPALSEVTLAALAARALEALEALFAAAARCLAVRSFPTAVKRATWLGNMCREGRSGGRAGGRSSGAGGGKGIFLDFHVHVIRLTYTFAMDSSIVLEEAVEEGNLYTSAVRC